MLREIKARASARASFAFETTLAGRSYVRQILLWRVSGYWVEIFF